MATIDDTGVDFLMEVVKHQGIGCATVKDGHVLVFKRAKLQEILDAHPENEMLTIFVKRPDFNG